jgi:hypothetical protein
MRIYYSNLIQTATLIPSSSDVNQDVERLKQPHLASIFRFGGDDENLVIDLQSAQNIKSFIVDIGNMTGQGTYTLEANTTDEWTSPIYSSSLLTTDTMFYLDLDETYRYWRLKITDVGVGKLEIGYVQIGGEYLQMPGISLDTTLSFTTTSQQTLSISGQVYGDEGYQFLQTTFNFPNISETAGIGPAGVAVAGRQEILQMWEDVENINPVWVVLWEKNIDDYAPVFCVFNQSSLQFKKKTYKSGGLKYETSLNLLEVR